MASIKYKNPSGKMGNKTAKKAISKAATKKKSVSYSDSAEFKVSGATSGISKKSRTRVIYNDHKPVPVYQEKESVPLKSGANIEVAVAEAEGENTMASYSKILKEHKSGAIPQSRLNAAYNIREASVIKRMLSKDFAIASLSPGEKIIYGRNNRLTKASLKKKYESLTS